MNFFISQAFNDPFFFSSWVAIIIFSICCHEYMHAFVALREGDPTARNTGHLTMNPLKQMGWTSLIMLVLVGICWGAVPVNPRNYRSKWSELKVGLVGPLTNFTLAIIATVVFVLLPHTWGSFCEFFYYAALANLALGILNILPMPGLDGWCIIQTFKPNLFQIGSEVLNGAMFLMVMLLFYCFRYLFWVASELFWVMVKLFTGEYF